MLTWETKSMAWMHTGSDRRRRYDTTNNRENMPHISRGERWGSSRPKRRAAMARSPGGVNRVWQARTPLSWSRYPDTRVRCDSGITSRSSARQTKQLPPSTAQGNARADTRAPVSTSHRFPSKNSRNPKLRRNCCTNTAGSEQHSRSNLQDDVP